MRALCYFVREQGRAALLFDLLCIRCQEADIACVRDLALTDMCPRTSWHPQSTVTHEAGLAVASMGGDDAFWRFSDVRSCLPAALGAFSAV